MEGYDYNLILTMFYISYTILEIPANILCKWMGPGWFIPLTTILFGGASLATAYVHNLGQMMAVRFLLGIFEAGMLPGIAYYLSRWYRRAELTFRLALYIVTAPLAGAFGGLLASAILTLESVAGLRHWRMIFFIEGLITILLGAIGLFTLTDRPATARWLSVEEKELAEVRVRSERVGQTQVLDHMDKRKLIRGINSPVTLTISIIYMFSNVTVQGVAFFAPTIVRALYPNDTVVKQQLFTVPPYVVGSFFTLAFPLISWRIDHRHGFMIIAAILPMVGYVLFLATHSVIARYAGIFLICSTIFTYGVFPNSEISANVVSDTARSSAIGFNVMVGNIGGIISTWSFLPFDGPSYMIGNGLNFATVTSMLLISSGLMLWMKRDNQKREANEPEKMEQVRNLTAQEIEDLDWKHPQFRWRL